MGCGAILPRRRALAAALCVPLAAADALACPATAAPWLGVQLASAKGAVRVRRVAVPSPAEAAGVRDGDLVVAMNGVRLVSPEQLAAAIARLHPGAKVVLALRRGSGRDLTLSAVLAAHPGEDEQLRRFIVGRPAADLGNTISVQGAVDEQASKWRGRVAVVEFWASWCASCKALAPDLARWHRRFSHRGLVVMGIAGDPPPVADEAVKAWAIPYPVVADPAEQSAAAYAISSLPTVVLVDRQGVVRDAMIGYDPGDSGRRRRGELERAIDKLLARS